MRRYMAKCLISAVVVLLGAGILSFVLVALSGKNPAEIMARKVQRLMSGPSAPFVR